MDDRLSDKVKVAVRVRPFSKRELDLKAKSVVSASGECQISLRHPLLDAEREPKLFTYDHCFINDHSSAPSTSNANAIEQQELIFEKIGGEVVESAFDGYNACVFAYGQTGSGKSHTMMGSDAHPGLIPRLCDALFERIARESTTSTGCGADHNIDTVFNVEVSYMEIYNERVRDLLESGSSSKGPASSKRPSLKVREHRVLGPVVEGLSVLAVSNYEQIAALIDDGNRVRTVAATNMNAESSRSHAVFTIKLTQTVKDLMDDSFTGEKGSKISLVDLAGSERVQKSGAVGKRLEEGANINKSLTTLGMVISALADRSANGKKRGKFVPYRDSVLTWLLKDNLGGNSRTLMIATVSPSSDSYEETLSTLRYADRAKRIINHAVVNEDPNARIIRELREEVESLRQQISTVQERRNEADELRERLIESERLIAEMNKSWEERLRDTAEAIYGGGTHHQREGGADGNLSRLGLTHTSADGHYLVHLNADPSLNELLVYPINERAVIGAGSDDVDFVLHGVGVEPMHALLEVEAEESEPIASNDDLSSSQLFISLLADRAHVRVNGVALEFGERYSLHNGDRLLIGSNHFFRVKCPSYHGYDEFNNNKSMSASTSLYDFDKAWMETYMPTNDTDSNIPSMMDKYLSKLAQKHEDDKRQALAEQYEEFDRYIHSLHTSMGNSQPSTPMTPMTPSTPFGAPLPPVSLPTTQQRLAADRSRLYKWAQRRDELFRESLAKLKSDIIRANVLANEANELAEVLWKRHGSRRRHGLTRYEVTLQIPACNLRPSRILNATSSICEPVIVARWEGIAGHQMWCVEQLESRLVDMREAYNDPLSVADAGEEEEESSHSPWPTTNECQEKHALIGVANVFLEVLFHQLRLDYAVPIISQQGEVCGKLHVEVYRVDNQPSPSHSISCSNSEDSFVVVTNATNGNLNPWLGRTITCRVRVKRVVDLPEELSNFVFAQYAFYNSPECVVVAPEMRTDGELNGPAALSQPTFKFAHQRDFRVVVTEEFLEYVQDDALSIEVWGHRSAGDGLFVDSSLHGGSPVGNGALRPSPSLIDAKRKCLEERWAEVTRRVELWVAIQELNADGQYVHVDVLEDGICPAGGVYLLKQGQQRRIAVQLRCTSNESGSLPLAFAGVLSVSVGSVVVTDGGGENLFCGQESGVTLDSYQEEDLERIREEWGRSIDERQARLQTQLEASKTSNNTNSSINANRERALMHQWMELMEERNAVTLPPPDSCIPGAPVDGWTPPRGIEPHVPLLYLAMDPAELCANDCNERVAGLNTTLLDEHYEEMVPLVVIENGFVAGDGSAVEAIWSWDSSIHASAALNRPSQGPNEIIYAIVAVTARLTYPFELSVVLRKRIALRVYASKKPAVGSLTERLLRNFTNGNLPTLTATGVYYDMVAHIPQCTTDIGEKGALAVMEAASADQQESEETSKEEAGADKGRNSTTNCGYIEDYCKAIRHVEWLLKFDRLRQESAIHQMLARQEQLARRQLGYPATPLGRMKRTISLPNTSLNSALPPAPARLLPNSHSSNSTSLSATLASTPSTREPHSALKPTSSTHRLMEASTCSSSGYASMVNSMLSPSSTSGRLVDIDEEQHQPSGPHLTALGPLRPLEEGGSPVAAVDEDQCPTGMTSCANRLFDCDSAVADGWERSFFGPEVNAAMASRQPFSSDSAAVERRLTNTSQPLYFANTINAVMHGANETGGNNVPSANRRTSSKLSMARAGDAAVRSDSSPVKN